MISFSDSRDPIFNSRDPNRVPKTPQKNPVEIYIIYIINNLSCLKQPACICQTSGSTYMSCPVSTRG